MCSCFDKLVKLPDCNIEDCSKNNEGELLLRTIPGITLKSLHRLTNGDSITYIQIIHSIIERAIDRIETDLILTNNFNIKPVKNICVGVRKDNFTEVVGTNLNPNWLGVLIQTNPGSLITTSFRKCCLYNNSSFNTNIVFELVDLSNFTIVKTYDLTLTSGNNCFDLDYNVFGSLFSNNFWLRYDANYLKLLDTIPDYCQCGNIQSYCCSGSSNNKSIKIQSSYYNTSGSGGYENFNTYQQLPNNNSSTTKSNYYGYNGNEFNKDSLYGLTIEISEICSLSNMVCDNPSMFKNTLRNAIHLEYMIENRHNETINQISLSPQVNYDIEYNRIEKTYKNSLDGIISKIPSNSNYNCCITCENSISQKYFI